MTKFKKKLTVIVSVFLIIGVLGSVAAIFAIQKYEPVAPEVLSTDVGYILGSTKGTGIWKSQYGSGGIKGLIFKQDALYYTFGANESWDGGNSASKSTLGKKICYYGYNAGAGTVSVVSDENGDNHLKVTTASKEAKPSGLGTPVLSLPSSNTTQNIITRAGKYVIEFDIKVDGNFDLRSNEKLAEIALEASLTDSVKNVYGRVWMLAVDSEYYTISRRGTFESVASYKLFPKHLKYGEWYNLRLEIGMDISSKSITRAFYANGELVETEESSVSYIDESPSCAPINWTIQAEGSNYDFTYEVDNVVSFVKYS